MPNRKRSRTPTTSRNTKRAKQEITHAKGGIHCWHTTSAPQDCGDCKISQEEAMYGSCFDNGYCNPTQCVAICKTTGERCRRYAKPPSSWYATCSEPSHVQQVPLKRLEKKDLMHNSPYMSTKTSICNATALLNISSGQYTYEGKSYPTLHLLQAWVTGKIQINSGSCPPFSIKPDLVSINDDHIKYFVITPPTVWTVVIWNTGEVDIIARYASFVEVDAQLKIIIDADHTVMLRHRIQFAEDIYPPMIASVGDMCQSFCDHVKQKMVAWQKLSKKQLCNHEKKYLRHLDVHQQMHDKWIVILPKISAKAKHRSNQMPWKKHAGNLLELQRVINDNLKRQLFEIKQYIKLWKTHILKLCKRKPLANIAGKLRFHVSQKMDNNMNIMRGRGYRDENHEQWLNYN